MVKRNMFLLAAVAAASLFFSGCATTATSSLKTVQDEFNAINRADAIKYAPMEYAQAEVHIYMANEECAEEGWLDLRECEEYQGIAKARMDEIRRKISEGKKSAKIDVPPPPPVPTPAPVLEKKAEPTPVPVEAPGSAPAPAPAPAPVEEAKPAKELLRLMVHFDFDRSRVRPDAAKTLQPAIEALKKNPNVKVKIEGHTCDIGTSEYNMGLSDRRANSAKKFLINKAKMSPDNIETVGYGEEKPAKPNTSKKNRQYNRRAEIVITE